MNRDEARAAYDRACTHDRAGREAEAIPEYERALAAGLSDDDRRGALVGLGSSLRNVARVAEAVAVLESAVAEFPEDGALRSFLALAHYSAGDGRAAVKELLGLAIRHAPIAPYARALTAYRDELP